MVSNQIHLSLPTMVAVDVNSCLGPFPSFFETWPERIHLSWEPLMKERLNQSMPIFWLHTKFLSITNEEILFFYHSVIVPLLPQPGRPWVWKKVTYTQAKLHLEPQYCWRRREERGEGEGVVGGDQERRGVGGVLSSHAGGGGPVGVGQQGRGGASGRRRC